MRLVVLIDWQNLVKACEVQNISLNNIIGEIVKRAISKGEIEEIRLFVPNFHTVTPWRIINKLQLKYGLEVNVSPFLRENDNSSFKDAVDFDVLKWVSKHIHPDIGPELVVFVSGDSHFLIAANEVRRKGKKVEFWFIDKNVSGLIRSQEEFRLLQIPVPIILIEKNPYFETIKKMQSDLPLSEEDKKRINQMKGAIEFLEASFFAFRDREKLYEKLSRQLALSNEESRFLFDVLMAMGTVRIYPAVLETISVDERCPFSEWLHIYTLP